MNDSSLKNTILLIKILLPEFRDILDDIVKGHGYFNLPPRITSILTADNLPSWASFYDDPLKVKSLAAHAMLGPDKVKNVSSYLETCSEQEKQGIRESYKKTAVDDQFDVFFSDDLKDITDDDFRKAMLNTSTMDEGTRTKILKRIYLLCYAFITQIHYYLAVMTFGKSICDLVKEAIAGDDDSFCKAVQIDRTVLFGIPYFQKRLIRAQLGSEPDFLNKLANAVKGRSLGQKLNYKELMFVFAILDDEGFLDMPLEQLMEVCQELGVYGREYGIEDVESLRKRRKYYRDQTGRQIAF